MSCLRARKILYSSSLGNPMPAFSNENASSITFGKGISNSSSLSFCGGSGLSASPSGYKIKVKMINYFSMVNKKSELLAKLLASQVQQC